MRPSSPDPVETRVALAPWCDRLVGLDGLGAPVVVACSGGADSLALLALLAAVGLGPVAVYVDHGLRAGTAEEADLVARAAAAVGASSQTVAVQVISGPNLEARARAARYAALEDARRGVGAAVVTVGHTADDQAETVVLNLMRGSAAAGLGAMAVRRDTIVRPLLELRRADTEAVCARMRFTPVHDPMNDDLELRRVWVREHALPTLSAGARRDLVPVLARQAAVLRSESDYLDGLARAAWPPDAHQAPAGPLVRLPVALARRAIRAWLGSPPPAFAEVERVLAVARGERRATDLAGGRRVERSGGELRVTRSSVRP